jgi:thiamine biosynthesis protein ThiS
MDSLGGDVVIVGAGLIGLATAFELAERGATVRVFDTGEPGRAASWAGAGMLAPYTEAAGDDAMLDLCVASLDAYPQFVDRVREASGVDPKLHLDGILNAAFDEAQFAHVAERVRTLSESGVACDLLDRAQTLAQEPALGAHVVGASLVRREGCVDNRRLGRALLAACLARGVLVAQVTHAVVECDARRALGVRSDRGFAPAGAIVNACGAWAAELAGVPAAAQPAVFPVKGQMLALAMPDAFVRRTTWVPGAYFVPRDDARLLVVRHAGDGGRAGRAAARRACRRAVAGRIHGSRELGGPAPRHARRTAVHRAHADRGAVSGHRSLPQRDSARSGDGEFGRRRGRWGAVANRGLLTRPPNLSRVKATINGEVRDLPDALTVGALLELLGAPRAGIAVARNDRVVRRGEYDSHALEDGDRIEIIKAVAGG